MTNYKRRKLNRIVRKGFEYLLLAVGLAGIGIWGLSHVSSTVFQYWANRVLDHREPERVQAKTGAPRAAIKEGALLGRIEIPSLHVQSVVREGIGDVTLSLAVGHVPGTALPGQKGNVAVAGHRDTFFRDLRRIGKNDLIRFETPGNSYVYEVESTQIVKPRDVQVLQPNGYPELTLVTCYPFYYVGSAPDRFIVKARQVAQVYGIVTADGSTP
jgi:sortase A